MLKLEKKNSKPPNKTQPAIFSSSRVVSRHRNLIAFQLEGSQLRRGLRGAAALAPEGVDLKLTLRPSAGAGGAGADLRGKPYLSIQARSGGGNLAGASYSSSLLAAVEIPISQPLYPSDIDALIAERDAPLMARFYVDLASSPGSSSTSPSAAHDAASATAATGGGIPACSRLRVLADRVLALAPTLTLSIDAAGRLEASAQGVGCGVSSRLEGLEVLPPSARRSADEVDNLAGGGGGGGPHRSRVHVASKDLARALGAVAAMNPARALLGIPILGGGAGGGGEDGGNGGSGGGNVGGHLHIVLAFRDSTGAHSSAAGNGGGGVDAAVDLSLRVPAVCDGADDED